MASSADAHDDVVVRLRGVKKSYRRLGGPRSVALDGLDLDVPAGGVHGFLGPNGAGKTTTLRILLGLVSANSGEVQLFGRRVPDALPALLPQVGSLIEAPRLFPQWGGRYNLSVLATIAGLPKSRVEECLELVGMLAQAEVPFDDCSLGMKQRLGIGAALLKNPRLLILDEPGNGLDPEGIREIRDLIRWLGAEGQTTVLVSSHQLAEVELMCDRVSIVSEGKLVASGPVVALVKGQEAPDVVLRVADLDAAFQTLTAAGFDCVLHAQGLLVRSPSDPALLTEVLSAQGQFVSALIPQEANLESSYLALTGAASRAGVGS